MQGDQQAFSRRHWLGLKMASRLMPVAIRE
jgi:hypothetical protein